MAHVSLRDIALLSSHFELREPVLSEADTAEDYPDDQLLQLRPDVNQDDAQFVCFIDGKLDDEVLPFSFSFTMGFLFSVSDADEQRLGPEELQSTLTWLAFPYIRELVVDITSRAPVPTYFMPPMTRLPHPEQVEGAQDLRREEVADDEDAARPGPRSEEDA